MDTTLKPAGFWRRVAARLLDTAVLFPFNFGSYWLASSSRDTAILSTIVFFPLAPCYFVYCHHRWGQTLGKRVFGARVVTMEGGPLSFLTAVLRSSVEIGFACLSVAFSVLGVLAMSPEEYASLGWQEQAKRMVEAVPAIQLTNTTSGLWLIATGLVLGLHPLKRALHDFIAGTRVVRTAAGGGTGDAEREPATEAGEASPPEPAANVPALSPGAPEDSGPDLP
jgi:uncharacterized RDD family membrane protein YckC